MPSFRASWAQSAEALAACLKFDEDFDRAGERLGTYAYTENGRRHGR